MKYAELYLYKLSKYLNIDKRKITLLLEFTFDGDRLSYK